MAISKSRKVLNFAKSIGDEHKSCKFLEDYNIKLPALVIGSKYLQFNNRFKVLKLNHQTGGLMCHHHYMYATVLPQSDFFKENVKQLETNFGEHAFSMFSTSLKEYNKYNNFLKGKLRLTGCDDNFFYVEEAIYPISFNYENLTKLSSIKLPASVKDDETLFEYFLDNKTRSIPFPQFNIFVLTENSD